MGRVSTIVVSGKNIGPASPCFIVAEAGVNHNGQLDIAKRLIDQAQAVGADAVKFQIFIPEEIATFDSPKADYQLKSTGQGESQYEMLKRLAFDENQFRQLKEYADKVGIIFFATIHDERSIETFSNLDLPIIKIASSDSNNGLMLYKIAINPRLKNKPLFLSTGGIGLDDIKRSTEFLREKGFVGGLLVYQSVSSYPAPRNEQNLKVVSTFVEHFAQQYGVLIGFSDNGNDIDVPVEAVKLGAVSVEKHMTLDKEMEGPDHKVSLDGEDFAVMVKLIRDYEKSKTPLTSDKSLLGDGIKRVMPSEMEINKVGKKAVRANANLPIGHQITILDLVCKRPQGVLSPMDFEKLIGAKVVRSIKADEEVSLDKIQV